MTFYSLLKPYKSKLFLVLACIFGVNLLALILPFCIKIIIDDVIVSGNIRLLYIVSGVLFLTICLKLFIAYQQKYIANITGEEVLFDLREKVYWHLLKLSMAQFKKFTPSQLIVRLTGDLESIRRFIFNDVFTSLHACMSLLIIFSILLFLNLKLTLLSLMIFPIFVGIYFKIYPKLKNNHKNLRESWGYLVSRMSEVIHGFATVRAFTGEKFEQYIFLKNKKLIMKQAIKAHHFNSGLWSLVEFFSTLGIIFVLFIGAQDVISGRMTAGELIAFYSYLLMLFSPVVQLVVIQNSYHEAAAGLARINEIFAINIDKDYFGVSLNNFLPLGCIELRNVDFSYTDKKKILQNINFKINPGETVAIVGESGAGKSTLISLILRFFHPKKGEILIDGSPLSNLDIEKLRRQMAVVLQDEFLFNGTVEENIIYGTHLQAPTKEVQRSAELAEAHSFIEKLPAKYQSKIGERGMCLSGGQKQRLAIARALLRNPRILILDEATSALDAITENRLQKNIQQFMKDRITLIVAHRFSSIVNADKIIVIEGGKVSDMGSHKYLLNKGGFYSSLYYEQFKDNTVRTTASQN